jgi:integrase
MKAKNKRRITQMALAKAKATGNRPDLIWDTLCPGLVLTIQPSGHKSFRFFYSIGGRARWIHLGRVHYVKDARDAGYAIRADIAKGRDPWTERRRNALQQNTSFADVYRRYVAEHAQKVKKSWKQGDHLILRYVLPKLGKIDITAINRGDIKAMVAKIAAPMLARQVLLATSAVFKWAIGEDLASVNPVKGVARAKSKDRERILSDSEIVLFWKEFERLDPVRCAALKCLLLTGQRLNEVCFMRREHIAKDNWWTLPGTPLPQWPGTKNACTHYIFLAPAVRDIIAGLDNDNNNIGFVFATARGKAVSGLAAAMSSICTRLGVERATPHDLRRTHGTQITRLGFGRDDLNRIQNHKEGGTTDVYDRYMYERENKQIMERVAEHIVAIAEGREGDNVVRVAFNVSEQSIMP